MFLSRLKVLAVMALSGLAWSAQALEYQPMQEQGLRYVIVSGTFLPSEDLSPLVSSVQSIDARFLSFNSGGGSVESAMRLGRMIRTLQLNTVQLRSMECASACSLAFIGGVQRFAEAGSIGVHRSSFDSGSTISRDEAVTNIQIGTGEILGYLREMGVDSGLLEVALKYDHSDIRYLSSSEMQQMGVTNTGPNSPQLTAPSTPVAVDDELERKATAFVRGLIEQNGDDPGGALASVQAYYAPTINYYGKTKTLSDVVTDKQAYFKRWPERGYRIRDESIFVTCNPSICTVSGIYDWMVRSLTRNKQAKGTARFSYSVTFGASPKIVAENGEVIR